MNEQALILVADDDQDILNLICIRLERAGYECMRAHDGEEALRLATERTPDLCILDIVMPKRTGYDVLAALKADPKTAEVPVILVTATVQEREQARGMELGASAHLTKPFNAAELQERVRELLQHR